MQQARIILSTLAALLLAAPGAQASMAGIGNATVTKGALLTHLRGSYNEDDKQSGLDDRVQSRVMVDYGVTERYAIGLYLQGDQRSGDDMELDAVILDQRFELTEQDTHGYYSGLRLRYTHRDGDKTPSNAHVRFILGKAIGPWDVRYNQIIGHEVGRDSSSGLLVDTRMQTTYGYAEFHRAGIESFSDFGNVSDSDGNTHVHTLGPVFTGFIDDTIQYEAGYRVGLSEAAPDHTVKLFLTKSW